MPPHWDDGSTMTQERYEKWFRREAELARNQELRRLSRLELSRPATIRLRRPARIQAA